MDLTSNLLPAAFEGEFVRLRPVARSDHPQLFAERISLESSHLYALGPGVPPFERWEANELSDLLSSGPVFVVENHHGVFAGLVRLFRMELRDGRSYAEFRLPSDIDSAAVMETFLAFLDYVFGHVNLRRLYVETSSLDDLLSDRLQKFGFQEEVRLNNYLVHGASHADLLFFAMSDSAWQREREHLITSLAISHAAYRTQEHEPVANPTSPEGEDSTARHAHHDSVTNVADVILDGVRNEDLPTLGRWMNGTEELHLWTTRRMPLPYEDVEANVRERCKSGLFTVIRNSTTGELGGFVDGALRELHGVAEFEVYLARKWRLRGLWAVYRFIDHLFSSYPLRKLYCQTYAYNGRVVRLLEDFGFVEEGRFKEFTWWRDSYWDMLIFSLERGALGAIQSGDGRIGYLLKQVKDANAP